MRQHWSNPHTLLTWLQLNFTRSFEWNYHWRDRAFVMLLTSCRMRRQSWTAFTKWFPGMSLTLLQSLAEVYICTRGLHWRKCSLYDYTGLYLSEIKWFQVILKLPFICNCDFVVFYILLSSYKVSGNVQSQLIMK